MTNDRPVYILQLVNENVYWPIIGPLYYITSFFIHYKLLQYSNKTCTATNYMETNQINAMNLVSSVRSVQLLFPAGRGQDASQDQDQHRQRYRG